MSKNELVLLDRVIAGRQEERLSPLAESEAFEVFACEYALRERDLTTEEIEAGVVGGGQDGGIDGVYVFLGDSLLNEDAEVLSPDFPAAGVSRQSRLVLWLVQAKREESFSETALDKISSSARRLLNLQESEEDLRALYSPELVSKVGIFRRVYQNFASRHLEVSIRFSYVTRGETSSINSRVEIKAQDLTRLFETFAPGEKCKVEFLGSSELWERVNTVPSYTVQLPYRENATSGTSHVALVTLRDYLRLIQDEGGALRRHIFDWNVRDYEGDVEVNREMGETIADLGAPEFWWLNNGVTIICSKTSIVGKVYSLDDVQIVNGLQTSHTLHRSLKNLQPDHPAFDREVLVRILQTEDASVRDKVIRATNRQTTVPAASLRATDEIQRSIEAYFKSAGWFYDRRKNFYRNAGKSAERIISIPLLAQSVMAMGLSSPHIARSRPSSLLKKDEEYSRIFNPEVDLGIYLWLAKSQKFVDGFLLSSAAGSSVQERTNLRFHLAMMSAEKLVGQQIHSPKQLHRIVEENTLFSLEGLVEDLSNLRRHFSNYADSTGSQIDKLAKGPGFVNYLRTKIVDSKVGKDGAV